MTKIINLWAGPGTGKSSIAADLFSEMKWLGYNVEMVTEVAKDVVWDGHFNLLQDQWYLSAMQNRRLVRLIGQVEYVITDSPLLMGTVYMDATNPQSLKDSILDIWNTYDNINFMLKRVKPYVKVGRTQDEADARLIDDKCRFTLKQLGEPFYEILADRNGKIEILKVLEGKCR